MYPGLQQDEGLGMGRGFINPWRVCAARVTVYLVCVCYSTSFFFQYKTKITQHLIFHAIIRATNDTFSATDEGRKL